MGSFTKQRCLECHGALKIEIMNFGIICYECEKCGKFFEAEDGLATEEDLDRFDEYLATENFLGDDDEFSVGRKRSFSRYFQQVNYSKRGDIVNSALFQCKGVFPLSKGGRRNEFRQWLVFIEKKSAATANNYVAGISKAQKHFNFNVNPSVDFYEVDDLRYLESIFDRYLSGEYWNVGCEYHGAVRAGLKAYLRFFMQHAYKQEEFSAGIDSEQKVEILIVTRTRELSPEFCYFDSVRATVNGRRNDKLPAVNKTVKIIIYKRNEYNVAIDWEWKDF